jgi:hypothetical protein
MFRGVALAAVASTLWWVGGAPAPGEAPRCSPASIERLTSDQREAMLAVATTEWWETTRLELTQHFEPRRPPRWWLRSYAGQGGWSLLARTRPDDDTTFRAQRFIVLQPGERATHGLEAGESFLAIPLGHGMSCRLWPALEKRWIVPGDTVVFELDGANFATRGDREPLALQHTYRGPHPGSGEVSFGRRRDHTVGELSALAFFEYVHALPSSPALEEDAAAALASFESWVAASSDSTAYSVAGSLRALRRAAGLDGIGRRP